MGKTYRRQKDFSSKSKWDDSDFGFSKQSRKKRGMKSDSMKRKPNYDFGDDYDDSEYKDIIKKFL